MAAVQIKDVVPLFISLGIAIGKLAEKPCEDTLVMALSAMVMICSRLGLSFSSILQQKMRLNCLKYPKDNRVISTDKATVNGEECEREMDKYTIDHSVMFTERNVSDYKCVSKWENRHTFWDFFGGWQEMVNLFASERGWLSRYTVSKVTVSLFSELGELMDLIEWVRPLSNLTDDMSLLSKIAAELADIGIYALHMSRLLSYTKPPPAIYMFPVKIDENLMPQFYREYIDIVFGKYTTNGHNCR